MTLQAIRRHFETPVVDTCTALGIPYRPANTLEPNGDAYSEFIEARLQFGQMTEANIGDCTSLENIRGSFVIEYYGPKGRGPARAQEVMELLFCEMLALKGVSDINGPNFTELDDRPYYFASMSMAIITNNGIVMSGSGNAELDAIYVNVDGDIMKGSLTIDNTAELKLPGAASVETVVAEISPDGTVKGSNNVDSGTY